MPIHSINNQTLTLKKIKGDAVSENAGVFTISKNTTPEIRSAVVTDINGTAHTDRTFSSVYINNNFFQKVI